LEQQTHHERTRSGDRDGSGAGPPPRRQLVIGGSVLGVVLTVVLAFAAYGAVRDVPYRCFTKEVLEQTGLPIHTGFLACGTWFLWVLAGAGGLLAAAVLARDGRGDRRVPFFLAATALTCLLFLDDFVMLHDRLLPRLGAPEELLYAAYALLLVTLLVRFRSQFVQGGALLAAAAGAFWAASLAADFLQEHWRIHAHVFEDGAKMAGTALWAAFMVSSCLAAVRAAPLRPEEPSNRADAEERPAPAAQP
jgi:hypothetical protein